MRTCDWSSELAALGRVLNGIVIDSNTNSHSNPANDRPGVLKDYVGSALEIFGHWQLVFFSDFKISEFDVAVFDGSHSNFISDNF
jgi:hypothetical protein